jgi:hypothetical protein
LFSHTLSEESVLRDRIVDPVPLFGSNVRYYLGKVCVSDSCPVQNLLELIIAHEFGSVLEVKVLEENVRDLHRRCRPPTVPKSFD